MKLQRKLGYVVSGIILVTFLGSLGLHANGSVDLNTLPELAYFIYLSLVAAGGYYTLGDAMGEGADLVDSAQSSGDDESTK